MQEHETDKDSGTCYRLTGFTEDNWLHQVTLITKIISKIQKGHFPFLMSPHLLLYGFPK